MPGRSLLEDLPERVDLVEIPLSYLRDEVSAAWPV
jgi:hypothetical protein